MVMEEQAAVFVGSDSATAVVRDELLSRLAGRYLIHWQYRLLSTCWASWSAWVDQRVTWSMAVEQVLTRLWLSRLKAVFVEWCAWIELRQAWAEMLLQGLGKMDSVCVEFFFRKWSSHAAEMARLDSLFRHTVQRLSYGCVTRALKAWSLVARFHMRSRGVGARLIKVHASRKLRRIMAAWQLRAQVTATRKEIDAQAASAMRMAAEEVHAMQINRDEQLDNKTADLLATETGWQVAIEAATAASLEQMSELDTQNQQLLTQLSHAGSAQARKEDQLRDLRKGLADQAAVAQTVKDDQLCEMRKRMQEDLSSADSAKEDQLRALHKKMQDAAAAALTVKEEELRELRKEMTDAAAAAVLAEAVKEQQLLELSDDMVNEASVRVAQPDVSRDMEELALAVREMEGHVREQNVAAAAVRSSLLAKVAGTAVELRRHRLLLRCIQEWRSWASMQASWSNALEIAASQVERVRVRQVWQRWAGDMRTVKLERLQAEVMRSRTLVASSAQAEAELAAAAAENVSAVAALEQQIAAMSPKSAMARLKDETVSLREELSGLHTQLQSSQAVNALTESKMVEAHNVEVAGLKALVAEKESVANTAEARAQALEMHAEATKDPAVVAQEAREEARAEANATAKSWLERIQSSRAKELQEIADERAEHAQLEADNAQLRRTAAADQQEAGKLISSMEIMRKRASEALMAKTQARLQATALVAWLNHHHLHKRLEVCLKVFARRRSYDSILFCFEHWLGVSGIQRQELSGAAAADILAAQVSSDSATSSDEDGGAEWHVVESGASAAMPLVAQLPSNAEQEREPPLAITMPAQEEEDVQEGVPGEAVVSAEWRESVTGGLHPLEDEEEAASSPTSPRLLDESFSDDVLSADDMTGFREEMDDESFSDSDASAEWEVVHALPSSGTVVGIM